MSKKLGSRLDRIGHQDFSWLKEVFTDFEDIEPKKLDVSDCILILSPYKDNVEEIKANETKLLEAFDLMKERLSKISEFNH